MFGKKKNLIIKAMHYEGLTDFIQNAPCEIEIKEGNFLIKRIKPEVIVTLPIERIKRFECLSENDFFTRYHNTSIDISKNRIQKYFLVVTYNSKEFNEKYLVFWAVPPQSMKFIDLQYKYNSNTESYSL